ncbi:hypothetical protein OGATHE_005901 [Ogataea polymorpha]|uniref:Uncharacterized protein n=1 Tax=Ogataea polymorpha TaxID=460523 RepID=A0A9P8SZT4_9ASCO|nr:hypothetical protein OGATHE_005901 [Ogataea polymorpha]
MAMDSGNWFSSRGCRLGDSSLATSISNMSTNLQISTYSSLKAKLLPRHIREPTPKDKCLKFVSTFPVSGSSHLSGMNSMGLKNCILSWLPAQAFINNVVPRGITAFPITMSLVVSRGRDIGKTVKSRNVSLTMATTYGHKTSAWQLFHASMESSL